MVSAASSASFDVIFFDPSHVTYTKDLTGEFTLASAENYVVVFLRP